MSNTLQEYLISLGIPLPGEMRKDGRMFKLGFWYESVAYGLVKLEDHDRATELVYFRKLGDTKRKKAIVTWWLENMTLCPT